MKTLCSPHAKGAEPGAFGLRESAVFVNSSG
jgi:hypothetical protein